MSGKTFKNILLLFVLFPTMLFAQQRNVSGKVTDENGEPLTGVTVKVVNAPEGTITDAGGDYSLKAGLGSKLLFSYMGYTPPNAGSKKRHIKCYIAGR